MFDTRSDTDPAALSQVDVVTDCDRWAEAGLSEETVRRAAVIAMRDVETDRAASGDMAAGVTVLLTDDERIRGLNARFRNNDRPTNVLSFPSGEPGYRGDIAIAYETVAREARDRGITLIDHLNHLVVHGVLHLFDFDHHTNDDADRMENREIKILASLGVTNPYEGSIGRLPIAAVEADAD